MAITILYSAVDSAVQLYPQMIVEMRAFFADHQIPVAATEALAETAARLQSDPMFHDDASSMLHGIRLAAEGISTLELLAILVVAATEVPEAQRLQLRSPTEAAAARDLFQFVNKTARAASAAEGSEADEAAEPEQPEQPAVVATLWADADASFPQGGPESEVNESSLPLGRSAAPTGAGISRALALAADEESFQEPVPTARMSEPARFPRTGRRQTHAQIPHVPDAEPLKQTAEVSGMRKWMYAACGVLLGVLLGLLVERHRPAPSAANSPAMRQEASATAPWTRPVLPRHDKRGRAHAGLPEAVTTTEMSRAQAKTRPASPEIAGADSSAAVAAEEAVPEPTSRGRRSPDVVRPALEKGLPLGPASDLDAATAHNIVGAPGRVTTGTAGIMAANVLSSPAPPYPVQASAAAVQGEVVVEAIVGREGDVIDTRVVSGPLLLREAAVQAVQRWRYRPYEVDGKPAEIATMARLEFRLGQP